MKGHLLSLLGAAFVAGCIASPEGLRKVDRRDLLFAESKFSADVECRACWLVGLNRSEDGKHQDVATLNWANADFSGSDLRESFFENCNFSKANFSQADLSLAQFGGADLRGANFSHATLGEPKGMYGYAVTPTLLGSAIGSTDFSGADLEGATLRGAILIRTVFLGANLRNADLRGARFTGTVLVGADLRGAKISEGQSLEDMIVCGTHLPDGSVVNTDCKATP